MRGYKTIVILVFGLLITVVFGEAFDSHVMFFFIGFVVALGMAIEAIVQKKKRKQ